IWMIFLCTLTSIILTISRSSLVGFLLGGLIVMIAGWRRYPTMKNVLTTGFCLFVGFLLMLKAAQFLLPRFGATVQDLPFRNALKAMAAMMAADYPLGVGLGNYAAVAYLKYAAIINAPEWYIIVHNIWYLTLAEMGYFGVVIFSLF